MRVEELIERLSKHYDEREVFISYSDAGETLVIEDIGTESGVCSEFPSLFLYAQEINKHYDEL